MRELSRRQGARERLIDFTCYTKPNYRVATHNQLIASKLEAVERGEISRLLVMCPPRHGKSTLVSRHFPAWYMGRHPDRDIISASYGAELAADFGRDVRNIIASPEYKRLFPGVRLAGDSQSKERWHISGGGGYVAAGVGTSITGRGAHVFVIDDPVKDRASAESELQRETVWDWYRSVAYTRLAPGGAIILTLTRWHEDDLAGRLIAQEAEGGDQWTKAILPAIDADGYALWEESYPRSALDQIRATIGEYEWSALYEQRPRPIGGSFFSESSLLVNVGDSESGPTYEPYEPQYPVDCVFCTIDSAVKTGKEHDGLGIVYWALSANKQNDFPLVIIDWDYKQVEGAMLESWLPTVFPYLETLAEKYRARLGSKGAFIEDKASGMILLQQGNNRGWPVNEIPSKLSSVGKSERAINVSGYVHAGEVKFSRAAYDRVTTYKGATKNHLLSQILGFRAGTHDMAADDLLDCFCYGISLSLGNREGF